MVLSGLVNKIATVTLDDWGTDVARPAQRPNTRPADGAEVRPYYLFPNIQGANLVFVLCHLPYFHRPTTLC